jgi:hypothetical protein
VDEGDAGLRPLSQPQRSSETIAAALAVVNRGMFTGTLLSCFRDWQSAEQDARQQYRQVSEGFELAAHRSVVTLSQR